MSVERPQNESQRKETCAKGLEKRCNDWGYELPVLTFNSRDFFFLEYYSNSQEMKGMKIVCLSNESAERNAMM